jgi:hypothetical protein
VDRENSDETDRFLRAIAALSSASDDMTDRGRRITGKDGSHIASLIGEISETVLHRRLQFQSDADQTLTIEVNERRLLRLSALPDHIQTQWPRIVCSDLSETDANEVLAALTAFCQDANDLFVRSVLPDARCPPDTQGLHVEFVARLLPTPGETLNARDPQDEFDTLKGLALALVDTRTEDKACAPGYESLVPQLSTWLNDMGKGHSGQALLNLYSLESGGEFALVCLCGQGYSVGLACKVEDRMRVFGLCRAIFL